MLSAATAEYLDNIAWQATKGIVGADAAVPGGELYDSIRAGLDRACEEAHAAGLRSTMVQLSIVPDGAKVVG